MFQNINNSAAVTSYAKQDVTNQPLQTGQGNGIQKAWSRIRKILDSSKTSLDKNLSSRFGIITNEVELTTDQINQRGGGTSEIITPEIGMIDSQSIQNTNPEIIESPQPMQIVSPDAEAQVFNSEVPATIPLTDTQPEVIKSGTELPNNNSLLENEELAQNPNADNEKQVKLDIAAATQNFSDKLFKSSKIEIPTKTDFQKEAETKTDIKNASQNFSDKLTNSGKIDIPSTLQGVGSVQASGVAGKIQEDQTKTPFKDKFEKFADNKALAAGFNAGTAIAGFDITKAPTSNIQSAVNAAETITDSVGNPLFNAAGDFFGGGIAKARGLNTDKQLGASSGALSTAANVANLIPGVGTIASAALTGLNILNTGFGTNTDSFDLNDRVQRSSAYGGIAKNNRGVKEKYADGSMGFLDSAFGLDSKYNARIAKSKAKQLAASKILNKSDENVYAAQASSHMNALKTRNNMLGNDWMYNGVTKHANGGQMNLIPEGALHAHKHKIDKSDITLKGIPVITEEGGEIIQHAEIERNEIVFIKQVTDELESLWKEFNKEGLSKKEKDELALKAGKFLSQQIIENTDDRTGLMNTIE